MNLARVVRAVEGVRSVLHRLDRKLVPAPVSMLEMMTASWMTQAIYAAARLGIADELAATPLTIDALARRVGADEDGLHRLLRLLSSRSILAHRNDGRYELTALGQTLRTDAPVSMRAFALMVGCPEHWEHWGMLTNSVTTGAESVTALRGMGVFDYMETNKELAAVFNDAMTTVSEMSISPILAAYDFSAFQTVADIGGGQGRLLAAILRQAPHTKGILFDLAPVTAEAQALLVKHGVADRVTIESGSCFDTVPAGADAYLLKHVVECFDDTKALQILQNIRNRIPHDGRLLLIEAVVPEDDSPHFSKLLDMEMLVSVGGRERTAAEYTDILESAGFRRLRVVPTAALESVIEAEPR